MRGNRKKFIWWQNNNWWEPSEVIVTSLVDVGSNPSSAIFTYMSSINSLSSLSLRFFIYRRGPLVVICEPQFLHLHKGVPSRHL